MAMIKATKGKIIAATVMINVHRKYFLIFSTDFQISSSFFYCSLIFSKISFSIFFNIVYANFSMNYKKI